jgi:hypothetical protein
MNLVGRSQISVGVPFWLIGVLAERWPEALIVAPVLGLLAAAGLYRFTYTRAIQEGIRRAHPPTTHERESALATRGRAALMILVITPIVLLGAASDQMAIAGALISCNGVAVRMAGRRLRRWEIDTGKQLLREPRRRRGEQAAGARHGFLDARDFYVASG